MNIKVKKLYDISKVVVPEELTKWKVSDEQLDEQLVVLSKLSAKLEEAANVEKGDCVKCSCSKGALSGREVLLYPGLNLPGAEAAEAAVLGLAAGSELTVELNGEVTLKVEKIMRRIPVTVNDELIVAQGIDGITTIDAYRVWYREHTSATNREQALKEIKSYMLDELAAHSEFEYDEAEVMGEIAHQIEEQQAYMTQLTGEVPTEADIAAMKEHMLQMCLRVTAEQEICISNGFTFTKDMFEDQIEEMKSMPGMADMPGFEDMLDEYRDMYVNQAYMEKASELMDEQATSCLEVE